MSTWEKKQHDGVTYITSGAESAGVLATPWGYLGRDFLLYVAQIGDYVESREWLAAAKVAPIWNCCNCPDLVSATDLDGSNLCGACLADYCGACDGFGHIESECEERHPIVVPIALTGSMRVIDLD